jgi:hypothetical protein
MRLSSNPTLMQEGEPTMKSKILCAAAGFAALCVASEANAQVLLKGYYNFTGAIAAEAGGGCAAPLGLTILANINWPGYGKTGFAMANATNTGNPAYTPGVAVQNGFPKTPANPAALAAGWAGVASDAVYQYSAVPPYIVVVQAPTPATFAIALASAVNGTAVGTITYNVPALNCSETLAGTLVESSP